MEKICNKNMGMLVVVAIIVIATVMYGVFLLKERNATDRSYGSDDHKSLLDDPSADRLDKTAEIKKDREDESQTQENPHNEPQILSEIDAGNYGVVRVVNYPSAQVVKVIYYPREARPEIIETVDYEHDPDIADASYVGKEWGMRSVRDIISISAVAHHPHLINMHISLPIMSPGSSFIVDIGATPLAVIPVDSITVSDDGKYIVGNCGHQCLGGCVSDDLNLYYVNGEYVGGNKVLEEGADAVTMRFDGDVLHVGYYEFCSDNEKKERSIDLSEWVKNAQSIQ